MSFTIAPQDAEQLFAAAREYSAEGLIAVLDRISRDQNVQKEYILANVKDKDWLTVLHMAASSGREQILDFYFQNDLFRDQPGLLKGLLNERTLSHDTPIHMAAKFGHSGFIRRLQQYGVDVNTSGAFGFTALHYATRKGDLECVREIVEIGATLDQVSMSGETALHLAARNDDIVTAELLITSGASATIRNAGDLMPGVVARAAGDQKVHQFFEAHGLPC
ncbi:ankyrin [Xylariomycetidae sp. FL0641]|nr:ankyrin [Xylariomycetidae sp. FL0641]